MADVGSDEVGRYAINASTGVLSYLGSLSVTSEPSALAVDPLGRFLDIAKQLPTFNQNLLVYRINGDGSLRFATSVLTGSGDEVGPIAVTAEPQGQFVYVIDSNNALVAYQVDGPTGILNPAGAALPGFVFPWWSCGISDPFAFSVSGTSPVWQDGCSVQSAWDSGLWGPLPGSGCFFASQFLAVGGGGGGGGGTPPPPPPASSFSLDVSSGVWGGNITSSPAGIDLDAGQVSAAFPAGSGVRLCAIPPAVPQQTYGYTWTGSAGCSGTQTCTTLTMSSDESCHLELVPTSP